MNHKSDDTDLTNTEWSILEPLIPVAKAKGRPPTHAMREVVNAIFYILRGGCAWRLLPHDFPPWQTVYFYFRNWRKAGIWEAVHRAVCEQVRLKNRTTRYTQRGSYRRSISQNH